MVTKDNSSQPTTYKSDLNNQRSPMDQSSPSAAAFPSSAKFFTMPSGAQQHVSPYGPPPRSTDQQQQQQQPQSAAAQQQQHAPPQSEDHQGQQYPQYSYDIQLRYPQQAQAQQPPRPYPNGPQYSGEPLPPMNYGNVGEQGGQGGQGNYNFEAPQSMDTTGQVPPVGAKPRVTATLWEDESTLCFQVDVKGTCVARREDNHMINGTKLLNVAGMTRGRRDGILKSEKNKHVVKIGPMHLKGVWIPYERALDFANREKITELLYPLFVHNIGALLHHPINRGYNTGAHSTAPYYNDAPSQQAQIPRSHEHQHQQQMQQHQGPSQGQIQHSPTHSRSQSQGMPLPMMSPPVGGGGQQGQYMYAAPLPPVVQGENRG